MKTELRDSYFAGIIDGEGCVALHGRGTGRSKRPIIQVEMSCEKTIQAIRDHFNVGTVRPVKVPSNRKPRWRWFVSYANAKKVADRVRPYMITKQENINRVFPK